MCNKTVKWAKKQLNKGSKKRLLIIAAVVILALFFIKIGGITHPHYLPRAPIYVMAREMSSVSAGGICTVSNSVVEFTKGTQVKSDSVAKKTDMNKRGVKFCCSESVSENCKGYVFPEKGFDCKEDKLEINQDAHDKIRACCPATQGEPCTIGFKTYKKPLVEQINSAIKNIVKPIVFPVAYLVSKFFPLIKRIGFH